MTPIIRSDDPFQPQYAENRNAHHCPRECLFTLFCCNTAPILNSQRNRTVTVEPFPSSKAQEFYSQHMTDDF